MIGAHVDGRIPVEAVLGVVGSGEGTNLFRFFGRLAHARNVSALIFDIDDVGVSRVAERPEAVTEADVLPMAVRNATHCTRRAYPGAVVLQAPVDVVGTVGVGADVVILGHGDLVEESPVIRAVERLVDTSVAATEKLFRVPGVDPQRVVVAMHASRVIPVEGGTEA